MDQLEQIRLERHRKYKTDTWLPYFFNKYTKYFTKEYKAVNQIIRFIKKYILHPTINEEELMCIPGIYRYRIKINNENLNNPNDIKQHKIDYDNDEMYEDEMYEDEIYEDHILNNENNENNGIDNYELQLNKALLESFKTIKKPLNNININNSDYELQINKILLESFETIKNPSNKLMEHNLPSESVCYDPPTMWQKNTINNDYEFWYCIDLRVYGDNQYKKIHIDTKEYYLTKSQRIQVKKIWNKINPNLNNGIIYMQNFEFYKSLATELNK